ncbi:OsmC family protein [Halomonas dongshanensis]|uniref:OsmC family protein n=1 Tax=Halomonas dongshanensis TaxID=2890835 RepID=A0ABT2EJ78_9GAMM|nr:OsmC family protein [Halomonas dongshanensis]MCS2610642.1 OsmC family protein [Halomonas dongshanensis]
MSRAPISVVTEAAGGYRQRVQVPGREEFFVDVPKALGGEGSAPDPHDYFDAAIASCKAITVQMYAARKGWPLERVEVAISRDDSQEPQGHYRLDVVLTLHGIEDETQRQRLLEISHRCPVHRLVTAAEIDVHTALNPHTASTERR